MKIYKNILKEKEKRKILNFIKKEVKDLGDNHPGLQTPSNMHVRPEMKPFVEAVQKYIKPYQIFKCWGVCSVGDTICWHTHPNSRCSFVYYLLNSRLGHVRFILKFIFEVLRRIKVVKLNLDLLKSHCFCRFWFNN